MKQTLEWILSEMKESNRIFSIAQKDVFQEYVLIKFYPVFITEL